MRQIESIYVYLYQYKNKDPTRNNITSHIFFFLFPF
jgi:hypothetical protein